MNLIEKVKEYIMGRPPGARNKVKSMEVNNMNEEPKVFDYENELENQGIVPAWREVNTTDGIANSITMPDTAMITTSAINKTPGLSTNLFLVEGLVQLRPLQPGRQPVQAEQNRIVMATDIDNAIQKYNNYFASLSTALEVYIVLRASASEAIM